MKRFAWALLAALLLLQCTACGGYRNPKLKDDQIPVVLEEPKEEPVRNPLTGEVLDNPEAVNNRPVAVMLNNIHEAMPQHGVSDADMIFEYLVEYGITRMVAFYQDVSDVDTIGSVRSARPYFVETVWGMDAIYVHAGGSAAALNMIWNLEMDHLDESDFDVFWRDEERGETMAFEHTLMTNGPRIWDCVQEYGWRTQHQEDFSYPVTYVSDGTPYSDWTANKVSVVFSGYKTGVFTYNAASGKYRVSQYDEPYIDGNTQQQVEITNLLVLRTDMYQLSTGHMSIDVQGSGSGYYICGGKAVDIQWHKAEMDDPFTYTLADGTPFSLGIGKTYVCVVDTDADVSIT